MPLTVLVILVGGILPVVCFLFLLWFPVVLWPLLYFFFHWSAAIGQWESSLPLLQLFCAHKCQNHALLTSKPVGSKYIINIFISIAPGTSLAAQLIISYLIIFALIVSSSHSKIFCPSLRTVFLVCENTGLPVWVHYLSPIKWCRIAKFCFSYKNSLVFSVK